ncbi:M15 family metallopeptidase [Hyphomonas sp.]|uniref:M15 family metallopeptidase n=1 Tax=Hyphomonas sp. TaxID=87 RepID=UPI003919AC00
MSDLTSPTFRNTETAILHPVFREALSKVMSELNTQGIPLFIFEGFRSPVRQTHLYAQGRTRPESIITHAPAWHSYHQYGLAVDMAFNGPGKWTWDEPKKGMWDKYHQIARKFDLMPLNFEKPHVQLAGTSSNALREGRYPAGGDDAWAENLASAIASWTGQPPAPPPPAIFEKPALA